MSKRAELYKKKYAVLMNHFQDVDLARKGRTWSWDRIYKKLGVDKPRNFDSKEEITLREFKDSTIRNKRYTAKKILYLNELGFTPEWIRDNKRSSYNYIKMNTTNIHGVKVASPTNDKERFNTWKYWSDSKGVTSKRKKFVGNENFPSALLKQIRNINETTTHDEASKLSLDANSQYAFALTYFMYLNEIEIEDAKKIIEPDFMGGGYLYMPQRAIF